MRNVAYTPEYREYRKKYDKLFHSDYFVEEEISSLSDDLFLKSRYYQGTLEGCNMYMSENMLMNYSDQVIYTYRNIDDAAEFSTLISHSNGKKYLIFRTELYGYSVFDIEEKKDFHYVPDAKESFIWTAVFYNPENNILLVSGCFWAAPFGLIMLDFTNPMEETKWIDIAERIDEGYNKYDDCNFLQWEGKNLKLELDEPDAAGMKEIIIPEEIYTNWLK